MNKLKILSTFCLVVATLTAIESCDNDDYLYRAPSDTIWLSGDGSQEATDDSVFYSFKAYGYDVTEKTLNVVVNLTGEAKSYDRTFNLVADDSMTNVSPEDYSIGSFVLPAGQFKAVVPVKVKRNVTDVDLSRQRARLTLKVVPTDDLGVGVANHQKYSIVWCDYLIKPATWSVIEFYIGPFSQARYKFIIDFTGYTEFSEFERNYNKIFWFQGILNQYLDKYNNDPSNKDNPAGWPYLNDNGEPLQFGQGLRN